MVHNPEKLDLATYYRQRGFSYTEIAKLCDVSKSTVSNWLSKQAFSKKIAKENTAKAAKENKKRIALLNTARATAREATYKEALRAADTEYRHYKKDPLFIAGLILYVGEGDREEGRPIRLSASTPETHRIFIKFARTFLGVEKSKIKFWLLLYPDLSEKACVTLWNKKTGLTSDNYYKNQVIQSTSKKRTLQYGVGNTIIGSTVLKVKLNRWIERATKELAK